MNEQEVDSIFKVCLYTFLLKYSCLKLKKWQNSMKNKVFSDMTPKKCSKVIVFLFFMSPKYSQINWNGVGDFKKISIQHQSI